MSNDDNFKGLDARSDEVQELMEAIPSWIQRWGITIMAFMIIGSIILCYHIRLPQKIEIELIPLQSNSMAIVYTPSAGRIHEFNFADKDSVSCGDTLLIFESRSKKLIPILSPICGHIKMSGPLSSSKILPKSIELMQIHSSESPVSYYYGYIKSDYIKNISVGDSLSLNNHFAKISFISQYPSSADNYYIEVTSPFTGNHTSQITHITIASETVLHKLFPKVPLSAVLQRQCE